MGRTAISDLWLKEPQLMLPRRKPMGRVVIDRGHDIGRHAVMFADFRAGADLVSGHPFTLRNQADLSVGRYGVQLETTDTTDNSAYCSGCPPIYAITNSMSFLWWGEIDSIATWGGLIGVPYYTNQWNAPYLSAALGRDGSNSVPKIHYSTGAGGNSAAVFTGAADYPTGESFYVATLDTSAGVAVLYRDGRQIDSQSGRDTGNIDWNTENDVVVNCVDRYGNDTSGIDGRCFMVGIFDCVLTALDVLRLYQDPSQFLLPA